MQSVWVRADASVALSHPRLRAFHQEVVVFSRCVAALAAALAAACCTVTPAGADTQCGPSGYAYAGLQSARNGHGISALVTALATPAVESGHVAGWVGVGAPGEGPGGVDEWIQVGLNGLPGSGNTLYYEVMRPGSGVTYEQVETDIPTGRQVRIAVLETTDAAGAWRVWVDGQPVTPPIALQGGERLTPMAMGESWDGGRPACNRYRYRFDKLAIADARGGSWSPARAATVLQDPGYRVVQHAPASFEATATSALPAEPQALPRRQVAAAVTRSSNRRRSPARKP
jgi:hypothetical protein